MLIYVADEETESQVMQLTSSGFSGGFLNWELSGAKTQEHTSMTHCKGMVLERKL